MRYLIFLVVFGVFGCMHSVYLKHPVTGHEVKCGPYKSTGYGAVAGAMREGECVRDFQRQGYRRLSE